MKLKDYAILSVLVATTIASAPVFSQEKGKGFENRGHEGKEFSAGKTKGKDAAKADKRTENRKRVRSDSKNHHTSSHGRLAGDLPPGLEQYEEKHGGQLPPGLEKQRNEKGHLPPGLEKGGRR